MKKTGITVSIEGRVRANLARHDEISVAGGSIDWAMRWCAKGDVFWCSSFKLTNLEVSRRFRG
jgi:hypothetical protein